MAMMMMHFIIWNLFLFRNMEIKIHTHWEGKEEKKGRRRLAIGEIEDRGNSNKIYNHIKEKSWQ